MKAILFFLFFVPFLSFGHNQQCDQKYYLYTMQKGECKACKTWFHFRNLEVDHITPKSKGGGDDLNNLQLLCPKCNKIKSDSKTTNQVIDKLKAEGFFLFKDFSKDKRAPQGK